MRERKGKEREKKIVYSLARSEAAIYLTSRSRADLLAYMHTRMHACTTHIYEALSISRSDGLD